MITSSLVLAVQSTTEWNVSVALVMLLCNLFAIVIGRFAIQNSGVGPDLPIPKPALWKKFGVPELIATLSFGHILGVGMILGLANAGAL
ncbi:MAG: photosystem I reaction center subunit PsaK [Prochloraceae cyanobacterium]